MTENLSTSKKLERVLLSALKESPQNARLHPDEQISQLSESYRKFGEVNPITVNKNYEIIAGHGRYNAAKKLGFLEIDVVVVDHLSEEEIRAYRIADNRLAENSTWDENLLAQELGFLIEAEYTNIIDFSPEITGFSTPTIDILLSNDEQEEDIDTQSTDFQLDLKQPAVSQLGDLWSLGRHKIICGDACLPATYKRLLGSELAYLVVTDPPYNVKINGFVSGNDKTRHLEFPMASGEMTSNEFQNFLCAFLKTSTDHLENGSCIYVCMDWRHSKELQAAAEHCNLTQLNLCVWDKGVGSMGSMYRSGHELVFVYRVGKAQHKNNIQLGKYGRNRTNLWRYPSANMSKAGRKALLDHPTPKPVTMIADIIKDVTSPNDIILDPFLGGGTSIIAAEKTRRCCYGIELDPRYIDATIHRWQELTGNDAINFSTKLSFSEHKKGNLNVQKNPKRMRERTRNR